MESLIINSNRSNEFHNRNLVLIIYDITSNSRRYHFAKFISRYCMRVQKSCFESYMTKRDVDYVLKNIKKYISEVEDSVRLYCLSAQGEVYTFGQDMENDISENMIF